MSEVSEPVKWRCFHCDACFTESQHKCAREHFGSDESKTPVCLMRVPGENGLIAALRRAENDLAEWRSECHPLMLAIESQAADHVQALLREEEKGYSRGLKDYSKLEENFNQLKCENEDLKNLVCDLIDTIDLPDCNFSPPAIEKAREIKANHEGTKK